MMKNASASTIIGIVLLALIWLLGGCGGYAAQPGETEAEGHRRHMRNLSINQKFLMRDLDTFFLADRPSRLTDDRID